MSTHEARVIRIPKIEEHPAADKLGQVSVWDYTIIVALDSWREGDLAAYIEPDTMVPVDRPEFSFLKRFEDRTHERIKVKKLRGIYSQGLLVPVSEEQFKEGDDAWEYLGLERYSPKPTNDSIDGGIHESTGPNVIAPKYGLENFRKYGRKLLVKGEEIVITEKLHGCGSRFTFSGGRMWCGSRNRWVMSSPEKQNIWWKGLEESPWIEEYCRNNPDSVLYGECYGWVQSLRYGHRKGEVSIRIFDVLKEGRWLNWEELLQAKSGLDKPGLTLVPLLYVGPYSKEIVEKHTDGKTLIKMAGIKNIREGCVVRPVEERTAHVGRIVLKSVSDKYLEKDKGR